MGTLKNEDRYETNITDKCQQAFHKNKLQLRATSDLSDYEK